MLSASEEEGLIAGINEAAAEAAVTRAGVVSTFLVQNGSTSLTAAAVLAVSNPNFEFNCN
jgi:hypothetical protein